MKNMGRQRYQLIPSRDVDDQRKLESDCANGMPDNTQPSHSVLGGGVEPPTKFDSL